jgi:hypothetical protein
MCPAALPCSACLPHVRTAAVFGVGFVLALVVAYGLGANVGG